MNADLGKPRGRGREAGRAAVGHEWARAGTSGHEWAATTTARTHCNAHSPSRYSGMDYRGRLEERLYVHVWLIHFAVRLKLMKHHNPTMKVKWGRSAVSHSVTPRTVAHQAPLSMGFSRQEYWNGVPFLSLADLPSPGNEPGAPKFQADALLSAPAGKPIQLFSNTIFLKKMDINFIKLKLKTFDC